MEIHEIGPWFLTTDPVFWKFVHTYICMYVCMYSVQAK
jgi:hypothetical protein